MRFYGRGKQDPSPDSYDDKGHQYPQNYPGALGYGDESPRNEDYDTNLPVQCPPHTTDRKLITRIDLHVIPFLCILYRTSRHQPLPSLLADMTASRLTYLQSSPSSTA